MKSKFIIKKGAVLTSVIIAIFVLLAIVMSSGNAFAASAKAATENNSEQVLTDLNAGNFSDPVISTRWFSQQPLIGWTQNEDYSDLDKSQLSLKYSSGGVYSGYINEERFAFNATDSTGNVHRLKPVDNVNSPNNISANGKTTVTVSKIGDLIGTCVYTDDWRTLKSLGSGLAVSGNSTKIGGGKIIYRTANDVSWGSWTAVNLSTSASFSFTDTAIQIAVSYEIKETGRAFWDKDVYYRLAGIYRFNIA